MMEFKRFHPVVNLTYFVMVIGFSVVYMHPVSLAISFVSGLLYSLMLGGKKVARFNLIYMLPLMLVTAVINPLFNHRGITVLAYLWGGNPLTLEAVIYGFAAAVMLAAVICYFSCFNVIMTSDKLTYLFGRIIPSLSLVFSMTLRFVPKFSAQLKQVVNAQKSIGRFSSGGTLKRAKNGLSVLSIMTTWALENSIETADSMKSRGFGQDRRTSFSNIRFEKRDLVTLIFVIGAAVYVIIGALSGVASFQYFPDMKSADFSSYGFSVFAVYLLLCILPVITECWEGVKWKLLRRKI